MTNAVNGFRVRISFLKQITATYFTSNKRGQLNKNSDGCRHSELLCYTGSSVESHPFGTFSWGDLRSLKDSPSRNGVDALKELRQFYDQYYYAANQHLVVVGAFTLDELQTQVVKCFSEIPARPRAPQRLQILHENPNSWEATYTSPIQKFGYPFPKTSMERIYRIIPVKERESISCQYCNAVTH